VRVVVVVVKAEERLEIKATHRITTMLLTLMFATS
jgi:hypothetical protein